jgi:hypothetical protein
MIILYTSLLVLLMGTRFLVKRRAAGLERKYAAVLKQANALLREPSHREGNSGKADAYQTAKRNFQLGAIAQKKETLEARHAAWQGRADRLGRWVQSVRAWKGRKLPYLLGGIDVFSVLCVLEYLGLGDRLSPRHVVQLVTTWLSI